MPETAIKPAVAQRNGAANVVTDGSTWASIWFMLWPLLLNMWILSLTSFSDVWIAGKLGSQAQAAVGVCAQLWFLILLPSNALAYGATAGLSRLWGAGKHQEAINISWRCLIVSAIAGLCATICGIAVAPAYLKAQGVSPDLARVALQFLAIYLIAQLPGYIHWIGNAIFRAVGKAAIPFYIASVCTVLVIALQYAFCLYPWHSGIAGIGAAWLVAESICALLTIVCLRAITVDEPFKQTIESRNYWSPLINYMRIGIPAALQECTWFAGSFIIIWALSRLPQATACQAAWTIGVRMDELLAATPLYALMGAARTLVGQNLGAKQNDRVQAMTWQIAGIGVAMEIVVALAMYFGAQAISGALSADPLVIAYSTSFFKTVALCEPFVGLWYVLFGAMQGAGYTEIPMWINAFALIVVRAGAAFVLINYCGIVGVWISIVGSSIIAAAIAAFIFKGGGWKHQTI